MYVCSTGKIQFFNLTWSLYYDFNKQLSLCGRIAIENHEGAVGGREWLDGWAGASAATKGEPRARRQAGVHVGRQAAGRQRNRLSLVK